MTRMTATKHNREIRQHMGFDKNGKIIWGRRVGYHPPLPRVEKVIDFPRGAKGKVWVSIGQIINKKKEFERQLKKGTLILPEGIRA